MRCKRLSARRASQKVRTQHLNVYNAQPILLESTSNLCLLSASEVLASPPPTASVAVRRRSVLEMTMIAVVSTSPTSRSRRPSLVDILALGPAVLAAAARERDREEALGHVEKAEEGEGSLSGSLNTMGLGDTEEGGQQNPTEPDTLWADTPRDEDDGEPPEGGAVLAKADSEMSNGWVEVNLKPRTQEPVRTHCEYRKAIVLF